MSPKFEQCVILKFLVKLGQSDKNEAYKSLNKVYGDECMSRAYVFGYFNEYSKELKGSNDECKIEEAENVSTRENRRIVFSFTSFYLKIFIRGKRIIELPWIFLVVLAPVSRKVK